MQSARAEPAVKRTESPTGCFERVLEIERVSAGYLCREIPENSVKGNGRNENCHRENCCESDFSALMVRPFAEHIHIYSHGHKRKRPTPARVMGRASFDQPSPQNCSITG